MKTNQTTRSTLLERVAAGCDPAAWREFHDRYSGLLIGFARRQGLAPADCDDVVQEVLLALLKSMRRFRYDPRKGRFRSYLKTLTVRAVRRYRCQHDRQSAQRGGETRAETDRVAIEAQWEDEWRRHHLRRAMRRIQSEFSEENRRAFTLNVIDGRSTGETATTLGISVDQVYQAKSRILRRLGRAVAAQIEEEART